MLQILAGMAITYLWYRHKRKGIDKCYACKSLEEVGKRLRYIPVGDNLIEVGYCQKCKPEIFP